MGAKIRPRVEAGTAVPSGIDRGLAFPALEPRQLFLEGLDFKRLLLELRGQQLPRRLAAHQGVVKRAVHVLGVELVGDQQGRDHPAQGC